MDTDRALHSVALFQQRRFRTAARRAPVNPYVQRIGEFPNRLFAFQNPEADIESIRRLIDARDVVLELGSGSGGHLIERARREPEKIFLGVELRYKRVVRTVEKAVRDGVHNLYILQTDARLIPELFPAGSIAKLYLNFPEPWDRRRWAKHRLMCAALCDNAAQLLRAGGILAVKSDHGETFQEFVRALEEDARFEIRAHTTDLQNSPHEADNVTSEFERLFRDQGLAIHFVEASVISPASAGAG